MVRLSSDAVDAFLKDLTKISKAHGFVLANEVAHYGIDVLEEGEDNDQTHEVVDIDNGRYVSNYRQTGSVAWTSEVSDEADSYDENA